LPSDKPSDIYQLAADATLKVLEELAVRIERGAELAQDEEVTPAELRASGNPLVQIFTPS